MTEQLSTNGRRQASRLVNAPAEAVWAVMSDGWLYANWVVGTSWVRAVDPGWPAEGCRIHHSFGVWPAVIETRPSPLGRYPVNGCTKGRGGGRWERRGSSCPSVNSYLVPVWSRSSRTPWPAPAWSFLGRLDRRPSQVRNTEALRRLALIAEGRHREWTGSE